MEKEIETAKRAEIANNFTGAQGARDNDLLGVLGALGAIQDVFVFLALEQLAADLLVK